MQDPLMTQVNKSGLEGGGEISGRFRRADGLFNLEAVAGHFLRL